MTVEEMVLTYIVSLRVVLLVKHYSHFRSTYLIQRMLTLWTILVTIEEMVLTHVVSLTIVLRISITSVR